MPSIEISMTIETDDEINGDTVSDAIDAMADGLEAEILWNYVKPHGDQKASMEAEQCR